MRADVTHCQDHRFDLQVRNAREREGTFAGLFDDEVYIELKSERRKRHWYKLGFIAIEYASRGKPSGILVTEATIWVHEIYDPDGRLIVRLVFEIDKLIELVRDAFLLGHIQKGGDDDTSDMVLLSFEDIILGVRR